MPILAVFQQYRELKENKTSMHNLKLYTKMFSRSHNFACNDRSQVHNPVFVKPLPDLIFELKLGPCDDYQCQHVSMLFLFMISYLCLVELCY